MYGSGRKQCLFPCSASHHVVASKMAWVSLGTHSRWSTFLPVTVVNYARCSLMDGILGMFFLSYPDIYF